MKKYKKTESGRSMVEMIGVLAVMGLITAASFVLIRAGFSSQKRSQVADEIDVLATNIRSLAAQAEDETTKFSNLPAAGTDESESIAKALLGKTSGTSSIGGIYSVYTTDSGASFTVAITGIESASDCESMATRSYYRGNADCSDTTLTIQFYTSSTSGKNQRKNLKNF